MAENHETKLYFAIRKETNQLVHISEMEEKDRGSACDCVCVYCGRPLIAKLGHGKRIKHFAHLAENGTVECSAEKANESGLHKMAKELICASTYICLPGLTISEQNDPDRNRDDFNQQEPLLCGKKSKLRYQNAQREVQFDGFKPDVCLIQESGKSFLIEIAVTHYVDEGKHQRIKSAQLPTVEINISEFWQEYKRNGSGEKDDFIKKLKETLIDSVENKSWIYHPREQEGIQRLCERNRGLEKKYQQNRIRTLKAREEQERREREKEKWIQEQQSIREQVDIEVERLHADDAYYLQRRDELKQVDEIVLNQINHLGICALKFNSAENIPFFFDIPVFGEVAFNCDRRIWQAILFEKLCYEKQFNVWKFENVSVPRIYCYFAGRRENLLNKKFLYIWKKHGRIQFQRDDLLCNAIEEYMVHLSALGFIDIRYYYYPDDPYYNIKCKILHNTLVPRRKEYAKFLKDALKALTNTNDPFSCFQKKWVQKSIPFTEVRDIDTWRDSDRKEPELSY